MAPIAAPDVSARTLADLLSLQGRVAAVTGGAHGIGRATCLRLAETGARVVVGDKDLPGAEAAAQAIRDAGGRAIAVATDIRRPAELEALAAHAIERFGGLHVWVNDAGLYPIKPALDLDEADWNLVLDTNLRGTFFGAQAAARRMAGNGGVIVNIASSLGYHGVQQQESYVASKFGVRGLTAALAVEWGALGIRVLAVAPGMIDTRSMREAAGDIALFIPGGDAFKAAAAASTAGRNGLPDDIACAVVVAVSDLAAYQTGSTILADGGEVASGGAA